MGSAISTFNDFVATTGPAYVRGPDDVVNEAVKNSYILRRFLKGSDMAKVIRGGANIKDAIILDEQSTFAQYQPNDTFTWQNPQVLSTATAEWRFSVDHMSWTDQEVELQGGGGLSRDALRGVYKNLKRTKEQRMWTSMINGIEDKLWQVPNTATMETAAGSEPFSIPSIINEQDDTQFGNGVYQNGALTGLPGGAWTTILGINPDTKLRWRNQVVNYNDPTATASGAVGDAGSDAGGAEAAVPTAGTGVNILQAFDQMWMKVRFQTPPTRQEYFENAELYKQCIVTSRRGMTEYMSLLRRSQDLFATASRQDPAYIKPAFAGIDLEYAAALDTAALYDNATPGNALQAEVSASGELSGPRYYWINGNYLFPVFHATRYMERKGPMQHPNQPFTSVVVCDMWWNLFCNSRQRQGIVSPAGAIYS